MRERGEREHVNSKYQYIVYLDEVVSIPLFPQYMFHGPIKCIHDRTMLIVCDSTFGAASMTCL